MARAADVLHLAPQTISGQLKMLEDSIGEPLFTRVGRGLAITDTGRIVEQYADEIFNLGAELTQRVKNESLGAPVVFNVGIVNSIPKLIAYRTLKPVMRMMES
ncbi:LysR family transcriptional regulator, partial [Oleiphilus sp. HI0080]|uniref:LysR family transcriptional regulator n=1 Tax=Oleiphilus sp. HI0080 TaxID=1822255 RepID=UPI001E44FBD4